MFGENSSNQKKETESKKNKGCFKNDSLQKLADEIGEEMDKKEEDFSAEDFETSDSDENKDEKLSDIEYERLKEELRKKEEELEKVKKDLALMVSENRNQKKRIEKEFRTKLKYIMEDFFKDFITVKDDFDKALSYMPENESGKEDSFVDGIKMIDSNLGTLMKKYDLTPFSAKGEKFDPAFHQAMKTIQTDEHEPGTVTSEYLKGYMYGDRLLRAAMVEVSTLPENQDKKQKKSCKKSKKNKKDTENRSGKEKTSGDKKS